MTGVMSCLPGYHIVRGTYLLEDGRLLCLEQIIFSSGWSRHGIPFLDLFPNPPSTLHVTG